MLQEVGFDRRRIHISVDDHQDNKLPDGRMEVAGLIVRYDPILRHVYFTRANGDVVGVAIGNPYYDGSGFLEDGSSVVLDGDCQTLPEIEAAILPRLAGPHILILYGTGNPTLYLDPGGTMPIVYDPEAKRAGLTTEMLLDDREYEARFDHELHAMSIGKGYGGWIVGERTAHKGVKRLLPNHALDLVTWQPRRFWPLTEIDVAWVNEAQAQQVIADRMRSFCNAGAGEFNVHLALTAGNDTRFVLSACRDIHKQVEVFTIASRGAQLDVARAREIASALGLSHTSSILLMRLACSRVWPGIVRLDTVSENQTVSRIKLWPNFLRMQ